MYGPSPAPGCERRCPSGPAQGLYGIEGHNLETLWSLFEAKLVAKNFLLCSKLPVNDDIDGKEL